MESSSKIPRFLLWEISTQYLASRWSLSHNTSTCSRIALAKRYNDRVHEPSSKSWKNLFQLLSEALGLNSHHLEEMECGDGFALLCHYYPLCLQPGLTLGTSQHADSDFLTVLLNDGVDGLQVLYQNQWVDVPFVHGALVVNIGDLLQLVSNDKFRCAEHRVLANNVSPRISVACFLRGDLSMADTKLYEPIKELLPVDDPPKYRPTTVTEYVNYFNNKGFDGTSALSHFRV